VAEFVLFVRGGDDHISELTPKEMQERLQRYIDWSAKLRAEGRNRGSNELAGAGVILRGAPPTTVVDGPYAEAKEGIGGYYIINAADEAEAIEIARECPALVHGGAVEVRAIIDHS
jgi:hypothetical protein